MRIYTGDEKKDLGIVQNVSLLSKKAGRVLEWRYILMNFEQAVAVRDEI